MVTSRLRRTLMVCLGMPYLLQPLLACAGWPGNMIEGAGHALQAAGDGAAKLNEELTKVGTKAHTELTNGAEAVNTAATGAVTHVNTQATNGVQHAADQAKELNKNTKWNLEKAGRDTEAEVGRFGHSLEDAAHAIGHYLEHQGQGAGETLSNAERRLREGKVVDALWHLSTEPYQHTSDNAALAVQESEYLNTVAQVAATAYGGPNGAAAYAAWLTYTQTGNADLALRAGVLTFATSTAFASAGGMSTATTSDIARKAAVTAAIGGLAVAAAGGDENAVQQGFLKAGAMVLVQDGYKKYTGTNLDGRASEGDAYCMTAQDAACSPSESAYVRDANGNIVRNANGDPVIDMSKVDPRRPHVGTMGGAGTPGWADERGALMTGISRIPGMNAMSVFHDQWMISWDKGTLVTVSTIIPATVLTYTGTGAGYYDYLKDTVIKNGTPAVAGVQAEPALAVPANPAPDAKPPGMQVNNEADESLFRTTSAIMAINCVSDKLELSFVIDVPDGGTSCRVVGLSNTTGPSIVGKADHVNTCYQIANDRVKEAVSGGFSCFTRDTGVQLQGREPPPDIREAINTTQGKRFPSFSAFTVGAGLLSLIALICAGIGYCIRHLQHKVAVRRTRH